MDEHFGEGGMSRIRGVCRKGELRVTGEFQMTRSGRPVGNGEASQLRIILRGDGNRFHRFNIEVASVEFGMIGKKPHRTGARISARRLPGGGPDSLSLRVTHVDETSPRIARRVRAPPRNIELVPAAVTTTGVGHHQRIGAVAIQMYARHRAVFFPHTVCRIGNGGGQSGGQLRLNILHRQGSGGNALEEQRFNGADSPVSMEAALHRAPVQYIVQSHQRHALVVRHVSVDHHAAPARARVFAGEIDGFVKSHGSFEAKLLQAFQIRYRGIRIHLQTEHGGVGRDHIVFIETPLQRQGGDAKSVILINLKGIERTPRAFGDTPRQILFPAPLNLFRHRVPASAVQQ